MNLPTASNKTAFYAGVWSGAVSWIYLYFEITSQLAQQSPYPLLFVFILGIIPTYPFVFGPRKFYKGPIRAQISDRFADFGAMIRRMLVWMFGAAIVMLPYAYYVIGSGAN